MGFTVQKRLKQQNPNKVNYTFDLWMELPFVISKADTKMETPDKPKLKEIMQNI